LAITAVPQDHTLRRLEVGGRERHCLVGLAFLYQSHHLTVRIERFDLLVPEPVPSPVAQLKMVGRKRQRASAAKPVKSSTEKWQWGDKP